MIIAREKRRKNIAEYILYMWQIEDIIRSFNFSLERIRTEIISQFDQPKEVKDQIADWYAQLIRMMKEEKIEKAGHLRFITSTLQEVNDFHLKLKASPRATDYRDLYQLAFPNIQALIEKSGLPAGNEIEVCLTGLYGLLLLRLQNKDVSADTKESLQSISRLIAVLSDRFKKYELGDFEM